MYKALNNSTYQTGRSRTHELDPVGSLFRREGELRAGAYSGTSPPRAVSPDPHLWSSESVTGTGSQLERSNANHHGGTRTHDPDQATLATKTADRNRHDPAERILVCPTLVQTTTLLF